MTQVVNHVLLVATLAEAQAAIERVRSHPECKNPDEWWIGEATYNLKPGHVLNCNDVTMDIPTRNQWAKIATNA